ncbi:MAG: RIP metalloprotease [Elusimicrobiaceae bacterium]|nr:RIP metalloprotease [Elusimicrobiaceae bacterium]
MLLSALAVIVVLSPIVIIHEFGHFLACRLTGIGVKEFSFGFGKILWHKKSAKGTDFQIRAIPFGGFVEPEGQMFPEDGSKEKPKSNEFGAKKWYAKLFMVVNGAFFNYVLAAFIFSLLIFLRGMPENDPVKLAPVIGEVVAEYPAEKAGLQSMDLITAIDGKNIQNWQELTQAIQARQGDLRLTVKRAEETLHLTIKDADFLPEKPTLIGIAVYNELKPVGLLSSVGLGLYQCWYWTKFSLTSLWQSITHKKAPDLAGPIGIVNIIHKSVRTGWMNFIFLIGMLSLAVGMFNLFPIPILDGGYALVFLWEGLTGKLPSTKMIMRAANVGFYILMILVLYASYSDIKRIFFKPKAAVEQTQQTQAPADNNQVLDEQEGK